ncbi:MAG: hypothetical protein APR53_05355 [Methanoculleus sp. SDB]|nr:MAG: hypothetical protein APR53_05355 [Methanoculleus sp. SDB]
MITYQGMLTDPSGTPLTGMYQVNFTLYDALTGGTALCSDNHKIKTENGLFTTTLSFDPEYFDGRGLWIGVRLGTDEEMTPRQAIRPVPYALNLIPATTTRKVSFPANALNYPPDYTTITQYGGGLRWEPSATTAAFLILMRPDDWDGASPVTLTIWFWPTTDTAGFVDFFIYPRSFNDGDLMSDLGYVQGSPVAVSGKFVMHKQEFTIPASNLQNELWYISILNGGSGSTHPDAVMVSSVGLTYTGQR